MHPVGMDISTYPRISHNISRQIQESFYSIYAFYPHPHPHPFHQMQSKNLHNITTIYSHPHAFHQICPVGMATMGDVRRDLYRVLHAFTPVIHIPLIPFLYPIVFLLFRPPGLGHDNTLALN